MLELKLTTRDILQSFITCPSSSLEREFVVTLGVFIKKIERGITMQSNGADNVFMLVDLGRRYKMPHHDAD